MKKIAIEEHFTIQEQLDTVDAIIQGKYFLPEVAKEEEMLNQELPFIYPVKNKNMVNKLLDVGEGRIREMDRDGIDMQILSLVSPGVQVFD
ncbi:MAG: amidohydrolase, partial [Candidatus Aminicenantes bacterium]